VLLPQGVVTMPPQQSAILRTARRTDPRKYDALITRRLAGPGPVVREPQEVETTRGYSPPCPLRRGSQAARTTPQGLLGLERQDSTAEMMLQDLQYRARSPHVQKPMKTA